MGYNPVAYNSLRTKQTSYGARPTVERPAFRLTLLTLPASTFLECHGVRDLRVLLDADLSAALHIRGVLSSAVLPLYHLRLFTGDDCFRSFLVVLIHA